MLVSRIFSSIYGQTFLTFHLWPYILLCLIWKFSKRWFKSMIIYSLCLHIFCTYYKRNAISFSALLSLWSVFRETMLYVVCKWENELLLKDSWDKTQCFPTLFHLPVRKSEQKRHLPARVTEIKEERGMNEIKKSMIEIFWIKYNIYWLCNGPGPRSIS